MAKRSVYEWSVIKGVVIMDPDGWRNEGRDFDLSERMAEAEFNRLMMPSTVQLFPRPNIALSPTKESETAKGGE